MRMITSAMPSRGQRAGGGAAQCRPLIGAGGASSRVRCAARWPAVKQSCMRPEDCIAAVTELHACSHAMSRVEHSGASAVRGDGQRRLARPTAEWLRWPAEGAESHCRRGEQRTLATTRGRLPAVASSSLSATVLAAWALSASLCAIGTCLALSGTCLALSNQGVGIDDEDFR
jgi:hypothetical protein